MPGLLYQLYLQGLYHWNLGTEEGLTKAIDYFSQAVARDPNYALAYARLADAYVLSGDFGYVAPKDVWEHAKSAATDAIKIDDTLPEAHMSLALVRASYDWNWPGAELEFKRAIALNPNSATVRQRYGEFLTRLGRFEEAGAEQRVAQDLDPLSPSVNTSVGRQLYFARNYWPAIETLRKTPDLNPNFLLAQHALEAAYFQSDMYKEAIGIRQKVFTRSGNPDLAAAIGKDYNKSGYLGVLQNWLEGLQGLSKRAYVSSYQIAQIYAVLESVDCPHLLKHFEIDFVPDVIENTLFRISLGPYVWTPRISGGSGSNRVGVFSPCCHLNSSIRIADCNSHRRVTGGGASAKLALPT